MYNITYDLCTLKLRAVRTASVDSLDIGSFDIDYNSCIV